MQQAVQRAPNPTPGPIVKAAVRPSHVPVNLGVEWGSRGEEFRSSVRDFFAGPRPRKQHDDAGANSWKIEFVERRLPLRGFLASCLWHVGAIWLMILPIWGFLPKVQPTLQPPEIHLTWYTTPEDLPRILLPSSALKTTPSAHKPGFTVKPSPTRASDTYHARQTILSVPIRVTHPRQTLIQPDAPPEPPKMAPALPNIVQWAASEPKLQMQVSASRAAPRIAQRDMHDGAAPEITDAETNTAKLDFDSSQAPTRPAMPLTASTAGPQIARRELRDGAAPQIADAETNGAKLDLVSGQAATRLAMPATASPAVAAKRQAANQEAATPAPDISGPEGDASLHRLIALSSAPALRAPRVNVPPGNLAARIAMSPEGRKPGAAGGAASGTAEIAAESPMKGASSLPAAISISGGTPRAKSGEIRAPGNFRRDLDLRPFSRTEGESLRPSAPASINVANLDPALPPETIFTGRQVYTMNVSMPNVTSASGNWILNFAALDSGDASPRRRKAALAGPVPIIKVDPKYPPELVREHVQGEVVLYAIIRKSGSVDSIKVMRSLDPRLDRDAAAALAQWKFQPGTRAGVPVDIEAVVHIPFNYRMPAP
jgi:TonB family protein